MAPAMPLVCFHIQVAQNGFGRFAVGSLFAAICLGAIYNVLDIASDPTPLKQYPDFSFEDLKSTKLDMASFENCQWSELSRELSPIDRGKPFSFGFQIGAGYQTVTVDPSVITTVEAHPSGCRVFKNGDIYCAFKTKVEKLLEMPKKAQ